MRFVIPSLSLHRISFITYFPTMIHQGIWPTNSRLYLRTLFDRHVDDMTSLCFSRLWRGCPLQNLHVMGLPLVAFAKEFLSGLLRPMWNLSTKNTISNGLDGVYGTIHSCPSPKKLVVPVQTHLVGAWAQQGTLSHLPKPFTHTKLRIPTLNRQHMYSRRGEIFLVCFYSIVEYTWQTLVTESTARPPK